jgi:hypothetical protein
LLNFTNAPGVYRVNGTYNGDYLNFETPGNTYHELREFLYIKLKICGGIAICPMKIGATPFYLWSAITPTTESVSIKKECQNISPPTYQYRIIESSLTEAQRKSDPFYSSKQTDSSTDFGLTTSVYEDRNGGFHEVLGTLSNRSHLDKFYYITDKRAIAPEDYLQRQAYILLSNKDYRTGRTTPQANTSYVVDDCFVSASFTDSTSDTYIRCISNDTSDGSAKLTRSKWTSFKLDRIEYAFDITDYCGWTCVSHSDIGSEYIYGYVGAIGNIPSGSKSVHSYANDDGECNVTMSLSVNQSSITYDWPLIYSKLWESKLYY